MGSGRPHGTPNRGLIVGSGSHDSEPAVGDQHAARIDLKRRDSAVCPCGSPRGRPFRDEPIA